MRILFLTLAVPGAALAVPLTLSHQGRLFGDDLQPLSGVHDLGFSLYDAETDGNLVWSDSEMLGLDRGYYHTLLGGTPGNPLDDSLFASDLWLSLSIDGDLVDAPHIRLASTPFARRAGVAENVDGGVVNASVIQVDGVTVIDGDGNVVANIGPDALDGLGCGPDEFPVHYASGWGCGTVGDFAVSWDAIEDVPAAFGDLLAGLTYASADQACNEGWVIDSFTDNGDIHCLPLPTNQDFAESGQACGDDMHVTGIDDFGGVTCSPNPTYDGGDFAMSDQQCAGTDKMVGIDENGNAVCAPDIDRNDTYDGGDFATSAQSCPGTLKVQGIDANGSVICAPDVDTNTTYTANDFVPSGQGCPSGQVAVGVDATGLLDCRPDANTTYTGANFATSNQACSGGQKMRGINASGAIICANDDNTTYSGSNFALSGRSCPGGQFMTGVNSNGTPACSTLDSAVNGYIRNHCYIHFGWRDSTDGSATAPSKWGYVQASNGSGTPTCINGAGADNTCGNYSQGGRTVRMYGLNTDGDVNGDDKFYIGLYCIP